MNDEGTHTLCVRGGSGGGFLPVLGNAASDDVLCWFDCTTQDEDGDADADDDESRETRVN